MEGKLFLKDIAIDIVKSKQNKAICSIDVSWDDAVVALGTESGTIELYSQRKLTSQAGDQLQDLAPRIANGLTEEPETENKALLKHYYTKANQGGILIVKFSWMNFLYTVGCVDKNYY